MQNKVENDIVTNNLGLAYKAAYKFDSMVNMDEDEKISVCLLALVKASRKFDKSRDIKFSTYAMTIMFYDLITLQRKIQKRKEIDAGTNDTLVEDPKPTFEFKLQTEKIRRQIKNPMDKKIFDMYNNLGKYKFKGKITYKMIAEECGVSKQRVEQRYKATLRKLRKQLNVNSIL